MSELQEHAAKQLGANADSLGGLVDRQPGEPEDREDGAFEPGVWYDVEDAWKRLP